MVVCANRLIAYNLLIPGDSESVRKDAEIVMELKKEVAHNFGPSHIFKTSVPKDSVIAYYSKGGDEEEILATVTDNFEIIR